MGVDALVDAGRRGLRHRRTKRFRTSKWRLGLRKDSVRVGDTTHGRSLWKGHSLGSEAFRERQSPGKSNI